MRRVIALAVVALAAYLAWHTSSGQPAWSVSPHKTCHCKILKNHFRGH